MLDVLSRIIRAVAETRDLDEALAIIVREVKAAMVAEVCSVYLLDDERTGQVLRATDGLQPAAINRVRIPIEQGLIGMVAERAEAVNLDDAASHPRYAFIADTGEQQLHGFLGVPIINHRDVLGVVVVRQTSARRFDDEEVAFLFTLAAQLAGVITHAAALARLGNSAGEPGAIAQSSFRGLAGASGIAMGTAVVADVGSALERVPDRLADDSQAEEARFRSALSAVRADLHCLGSTVGAQLGAEDRALFDALILLLDSDDLVEDTVVRIRGGLWAPAALRDTVNRHARVFDEMEDMYLRERGADIRDLGRRVLCRLQEHDGGGGQAKEYPESTVLIGHDLTALHLAEVPLKRLAGIVSLRGSGSSHAAILARAVGVPAVMGVEELPIDRCDGRTVVVDGYAGNLHLQPDASMRAEFAELLAQEQAISKELDALHGLPSETLDGHKLPLMINAGLFMEAGAKDRDDAAGVGLYRTELPFMTRDRFPSEDTQVEIYRSVLQGMAGRPVVMRTLDVGGDKPLSYFPIDDPNPFLGWRGLRMTLDHPEIFQTQIRAMLRADEGLGNLRIMLPMVTTVRDVDEAMALIDRALKEVQEEGVDVRKPPIGVMIEVPAAVYQTESIARRVDFLSVGTNDLTQYLLAVDRNNQKVASIYDGLHPAVLRAVYDVTRRAHCLDCPVSVCGELAGEPMGAALLLGMGVDSLSMGVGNLQRIKAVVRALTLEQARELVDQVWTLEHGSQVREVMSEVIESIGLGALARAGR